MTAGHAVVVGGFGYLGSPLTDRMTSSGWDATVVSRRGGSRDGRTSLPFAQIEDVLHSCRDATVVWLLAGDRHGEVEHLARLIDMVPPSRRPRFVHASSCSVYGAAEQMCDESHPVAPANPYAEAKARAEALVRDAFPDHVILRLATVHGHPEAGEIKQSVHRLIWQAAGGVVELYGSSAWRPFVDRDEAVDALLRAIGSPELTGVVLNVARTHATFGSVGGYAAGLFGATIRQHDRLELRSYRVSVDAAMDAGLLQPTGGPDLWTSMRRYARSVTERRRAGAEEAA